MTKLLNNYSETDYLSIYYDFLTEGEPCFILNHIRNNKHKSLGLIHVISPD